MFGEQSEYMVEYMIENKQYRKKITINFENIDKLNPIYV